MLGRRVDADRQHVLLVAFRLSVRVVRVGRGDVREADAVHFGAVDHAAHRLPGVKDRE